MTQNMVFAATLAILENVITRNYIYDSFAQGSSPNFASNTWELTSIPPEIIGFLKISGGIKVK